MPNEMKIRKWRNNVAQPWAQRMTHASWPITLCSSPAAVALLKKLPNRLFLCQFHRPLARCLNMALAGSLWDECEFAGSPLGRSAEAQKVRKMCASRTTSTLRLLLVWWPGQLSGRFLAVEWNQNIAAWLYFEIWCDSAIKAQPENLNALYWSVNRQFHGLSSSAV
jgi:hypothetical protein